MSHDSAATAAERGDTVRARVRWPLRLLILLLAIATVTVIALERREAAPANGDLPSAAANAESSGAEPVTPDDAVMQRQADLVVAEDRRLRRAVSADADGITVSHGTTIVGPRKNPYTLSDLVRAGAITRRSETVVEVVRPIVVRRGAHLVLRAPGQTLQLRSGPAGFTSIVAWGGSLVVGGAEGRPMVVTSWDDGAAAADGLVDDGRAYLRVKEGVLEADHLDLRNLGFWSGRTGGLALTGGEQGTTTGRISHASMSGLHAGLFAEGIDRLRVESSVVRRSSWAGIYLNGAQDVDVVDTEVTLSGGNGIDVRQGSSGVALTRVTATGSAGYGVRVDGSPRAEGVNAAGYGPAHFDGFVATGGRVADNNSGGLLIDHMDAGALTDLAVEEQRTALEVRGSSGIDLTRSSFTSASRPAIVVVDEAERVRLHDVTVVAPEVGVDSTDSEVDVEEGAFTVGKGHGLAFDGGTATISGAQVNGIGSAAITDREASVEIVDLGGDWQYRPDVLLWLERHSALLPYLPLVPVVVIGSLLVWRRHRSQARLRVMMAEAFTERGKELLLDYRAPGERGLISAPTSFSATTAEPLDDVAAARFAVTAVRDFGHPPARVARILGYPTSRVRSWVDDADSASASPAPARRE